VPGCPRGSADAETVSAPISAAPSWIWVESGRNVRDVAASLGIAEPCLHRWRHRDLVVRGLKPGRDHLPLARLLDAHRPGGAQRAGRPWVELAAALQPSATAQSFAFALASPWFQFTFHCVEALLKALDPRRQPGQRFDGQASGRRAGNSC
jgi:hypothetical protein